MSAARVALILLGAVSLTSCKPPASVDHSAEASTAIRAADQAWLKAFASRDTNGAVGGVEVSGSVLAPNAPIATGPAAIKGLFAGFYALPNMEIQWTPAEVGASTAGDLGYSHGAYVLSFSDPKGATVTDHGKYATVWRKQADGSWKVVLDIFNSDSPAP